MPFGWQHATVLGCALMGSELRAPGDTSEVQMFVETLLPEGLDTIRAGGIAYVSEVRTVMDLPPSLNALRLRGLVFVHETAEK